MKLTQKVLLVFALIVVIGGIAGMVAGSVISLVAAVISAALLLYSRWLWGQNPLFGFILGLGVSLALLGRFAVTALSSEEGLTLWPGGVVIERGDHRRPDYRLRAGAKKRFRVARGLCRRGGCSL